MSAFLKLSSINVNDHIEKKNGFSYLSWPYAVSELRKADPTATWEVRRFDGLPFLKSEAGYFVEVAVTVEGVTLSQIHPVLDHRNKPIEQPNAFHINTSIQRALVKAIALHGLGLYIYAGEDLPSEEKAESQNDQDPQFLGRVVKALEARDGWALLAMQAEDMNRFRQAFGRLGSKQKTLHRELEQEAAVARSAYFEGLSEACAASDEMWAKQLLDELDTQEKKNLVWTILSQDVKDFIKTLYG